MDTVADKWVPIFWCVVDVAKQDWVGDNSLLGQFLTFSASRSYKITRKEENWKDLCLILWFLTVLI